MSTPQWQPGYQYLPGAIVTPRSNAIVLNEEPNNNSFESGLTDWTVTGEHCSNTNARANTIVSTAESFDGSQSITVTPFAGDGTGPHSPSGNPVAFCVVTNNLEVPVTPGQKINFKARFWHLFVPDINQVDSYSGGARIAWYDKTHTFLSYSYATTSSAGSADPSNPGMFAFPDSSWVTLSGQGVAPANAAFAAAVFVIATTSYSTQAWYADYYTWDYTSQGYPPGLVFVAVQSGPGTSASTEPVWPVNTGTTVVDNDVTWEAEYASQITWTAQSILKSGSTQPTWPTVVGGAVGDNKIEWIATDGRITDSNCPNTKAVAIASSKVFAVGNGGDIIRFCATTNAQDWSASNDAGFIPFGLQDYGNEPCVALGLYRSNLLAFNSIGYQMWQVDPDPANIAILDAEPVGCNYTKSGRPVNNDYVFLSPVGIRNIGTAGSSGNLQAGSFGKAVDPIVKKLIASLAANGYEPRSLFNPGTGQYWLLIGTEAVVLTINGTSQMSWSRYTFPGVITDFTIDNGVLYLRAGDLVWEFSDQTFVDDAVLTSSAGGTNTGFHGYVAWNYLEFGAFGVDKAMEGFDLTIGSLEDDGTIYDNNITCNVSFGYNQSMPAQATQPYAITGDTVPGAMIPMPLVAPTIQVRLDFGTGQDWGWAALQLYVTPLSTS